MTAAARDMFLIVMILGHNRTTDQPRSSLKTLLMIDSKPKDPYFPARNVAMQRAQPAFFGPTIRRQRS